LHILVRRVAYDIDSGQLRIKLYDLKERSPASAGGAAEATL
jgi:hypothetical protein